jgi:hypothetical protein
MGHFKSRLLHSSELHRLGYHSGKIRKDVAEKLAKKANLSLGAVQPAAKF